MRVGWRPRPSSGRGPSRRVVLGALAASGLAAAGGVAAYRKVRRHGAEDVRPVAVTARPLGPLLPGEPERRRFGALLFRSGLVLTSNDPGFGGFSGLWRSADGERLVSISDNAQWLTARVAYGPAGIVSGLDDAEMAPVLGGDGVPLARGPAYDTEGVAIAEDGAAYVGIERVHEVRRFADWGREGVRARGVPIPVPPDVKALPDNDSLEAVGVAPPGHPLAGAVIAIAERARRGDDTPTRGWVLTGAERFTFDVARSEAFAITDMSFLPGGEMLLLERHYSVSRGVACRMRRIARDAIRPGATLYGPVLFQADRSYAIDNMEGLAIHRDRTSGETVLTLVSDDNFSAIQRTLLLEFTLPA